MSRQWDALVIGAGPAGLRAASVIAESGLVVVLVDEQAFPGGQIYRHVTAPGAEERFAEAADYRDARSGASGVPARNTAGNDGLVLEQDRILASRGEKSPICGQKRHRRGRDGAPPFRGWTLPGVMNAGAGDILLKTAGLLPETPVVLAGSGPLLYLVASHLIRKGHPLAAVLDQTPPSNMLKAAPHLPAGLLGLPLLLRGLSMLNDVRKSGTPVYRDVSGIEAQGADRLERVSFFCKGTAHTLEAATLLYHGGVIPRTHMANALDLPTIGMRASSAGPWPATAAAGRRGKACTSPGTAAAYAVPPSLG
ncbi:MAG: NAD(P)-binding protein [Bilophila wadsworthia]